MLLSKLSDSQISISLSSGLDLFSIERLINYAKYLESTACSMAKQEDVDALADEVSANWWEKNRQRFLK